MFSSREQLDQEIARHERMAADYRANLARCDDDEYMGKSMNREGAKESFRRSAESVEAWVARLRRFAEAW
jgi:hypothetical protein